MNRVVSTCTDATLRDPSREAGNFNISSDRSFQWAKVSARRLAVPSIADLMQKATTAQDTAFVARLPTPKSIALWV
jgi:hypothetical protein